MPLVALVHAEEVETARALGIRVCPCSVEPRAHVHACACAVDQRLHLPPAIPRKFLPDPAIR